MLSVLQRKSCMGTHSNSILVSCQLVAKKSNSKKECYVQDTKSCQLGVVAIPVILVL